MKDKSRGAFCRFLKSKRTVALSIFIAALAPGLASGQMIQDFIVDPSPPAAPLVKTIAYFTSLTTHSVILGSASGGGGPGGLYLYQSSGGLSGPWTITTIDPSGDFYERSRAFLNPGDTYPGVVASRSGQLVWYDNPLNRSGNPAQPWPMQVINPNAGCHDLHVADVDGEGKPDIVCSALFFGGTQSFIAYQNTPNNWQIVSNPFRDPNGNGIGDSVALVSINRSARSNVVGATSTGVYWFQNPGSNRSGRWTPNLVGTGGSTIGIDGAAIGTHPYGGSSDAIIVASGEPFTGVWLSGLVAFTSTNGGSSWSTKSLDSTYRAVHEIDSGKLGGTPFFLIAEQEQVAPSCNSEGLNEHPANVPACRVTIFEYQAGSFTPTTELSALGTQNQSYVKYNGGIAIAGANHNFYGAKTQPYIYGS